MAVGFGVLLIVAHDSRGRPRLDRRQARRPDGAVLGRVSLNPLVHIDWIGTVLLPLISAISGLPLIGWAKPVPVNISNLRDPRRIS